MRYFIVAFFTILLTLGVHVKALAQGPPPEKMGDPPPDKYQGFQIDYPELIKKVKLFDSTLVFKTTGQENSLPVHVATGINNSYVEIVGKDNNVRKIVYVVHLIAGDSNGNRAAITRIGTTFGTVTYFLTGSLQWMLKEVNNIQAAPLVSFKHTTNQFNNYQVTVEFDASTNTVKLTMVD